MSLLLIILLAIIFSGFFSGMEIAFLSSNRLHIELQNKKGIFPYRLLSSLTKHPGQFIASLLIGNNIALVIYGQTMHKALVPFINWDVSPYLLLFVETIISTLIILFLAEFIPKAFFKARADRSLQTFALPAGFFYVLFYPLAKFITGFSNLILRIFFKVEKGDEVQVFSKIDLDHYIEEQTDRDDEEEVEHQLEIFKNALDFSDQKAREFMIPRTEIEAVSETETIQDLRKLFIDTGFSKILVYRENMDDIIGYVHAFELFKRPDKMKSILRPVVFIPESMKADEILNLLTKENRSIAVIIDEFGGTSGMLTLEDVVEEIFGEIADEHDTEDLIEEKINEFEFRLSARHEIDYLNNKYKLDLPESDNYNTLSGLIYETIESIPDKGEKIIIGEYTFIITNVLSNRLEEVRLILPKSN